jgi:hypothetical protein
MPKVEPRRITDKLWDAFAQSVANGDSYRQAGLRHHISYATIMRHKGDPLSAMSNALAQKGVISIPAESKYHPDAKRALEDFGYFRQRYFARSTSPWAEEAAYKILELIHSPEKEYVVINLAPGIGKSSFFTHDLPAWIAVKDRATRQMIGSSTQRLASGYTGRLRNSFERALPIRADATLLKRGLAKDAVSTLTRDFGRFKPTNEGLWRRDEFVLEQAASEMVENKEASFVAFGADSGFLGQRFDVIVWDDLVTIQSLKSEESRQSLVDLWESTAENRLDPGGTLILQGQRLGSDDLYHYALSLRDHTEVEFVGNDELAPKKYHHIVYKAHYEDKCARDPKTLEITSHAFDAKPYPDGCLLDPYRLPFKELMRIKMNREDRFRVTYQQEESDPENSLVQMAWIDGGIDSHGKMSIGCWDEMRSIGKVTKGMDGYSVITVDPSPTKYWAIEWAIFSPEDQVKHILDLHRGTMDAPDFLDWDQGTQTFTGLLEDWRVRASDEGRPIQHLIVEKNAAQRFMLQYDHFRRWQQRYSIVVTGHETMRNKSDEEYGVQTLAPEFRFGRVRLPGNHLDGSKQTMKQLVKEVCAWPNGATDDTVMALWFLHWNAPHLFPSANIGAYKFSRPSFLAKKSRW